MSRRVLDPLERSSEILFGIIMVLAFTGSIRVADAGGENLRTVLVDAIGCNLAWGFVDAAMYLMGAFMERARGLTLLNAIRNGRVPEHAHRIIADALPPALASVLTLSEIESLRERLKQRALPPASLRLTRADWLGAAGVFLLVFTSTFPVVIPLLLVHDTRLALALSNAVAVVMLFITGWSVGRYAGRPGWRSGLGMVAVGIILVALTMALGG